MPDTRIDVIVDASGLRSRLDGVTRANREERLKREGQGQTAKEIRNELDAIDAAADSAGLSIVVDGGASGGAGSGGGGIVGGGGGTGGIGGAGGSRSDGGAVSSLFRRRSRAVSTWKRLDPSAQRGGYPVAYGWVDYVNFGDPTYQQRVYSAQRNVSASFDVQTLTPGFDDTNTDGSYESIVNGDGAGAGAMLSALGVPDLLVTNSNTPGVTTNSVSWTSDQPAAGVDAFVADVEGYRREDKVQSNSTRGDSLVAEQSLCLPVNSAAGLFVFVYYRHGKAATATVSRSSLRVVTNEVTGIGDLPDPNTKRVSVTTTKVDTISAPDPVTEIDADDIELAFLVGKTTIKAITFPAALSALLQIIKPVPMIDAEGVWVGSSGSTYSGVTSRPTFVVAAAAGIELTSRYGIVTPTFPQSSPSPNQNTTTSAGVFKALTIVPGGDGDGITDRAALDAFFLADSSVPIKPVSLGFCALGATCGSGFHGMDAVKVVPPTGSIIGFRPNPVSRLGFTPDEAFGLLTSWDWAKPTYCRAQLLALGFTVEDLTP